LFVGGKALAQVWLFLLVPSVGGILAGLLFRSGLLSADLPAKAAAAEKGELVGA
jgi:aquaporin Z